MLERRDRQIVKSSSSGLRMKGHGLMAAADVQVIVSLPLIRTEPMKSFIYFEMFFHESRAALGALTAVSQCRVAALRRGWQNDAE